MRAQERQGKGKEGGGGWDVPVGRWGFGEWEEVVAVWEQEKVVIVVFGIVVEVFCRRWLRVKWSSSFWV